MSRTAYLAGYNGRTPEQLRDACRRLDAVVVDIRYTPWSRHPFWQQANLRESLGGLYNAYRQLGNLNHAEKGAPIQIADLPGGVAYLEQYEKPVILLCACRDGETCHRTVVGDELRRRGWTVSELEWPAAVATNVGTEVRV